MKNRIPLLALASLALPLVTTAAVPEVQPTAADKRLADYFRAETAPLAARCLTEIKTREDWDARLATLRRQAGEMLGLWPAPDRSDLKATVTGRTERDDLIVENLHFQSWPRLYVTANLYLPKQGNKPAPTVLYLSGHARVVTNGVSYGNKTFYQHHGIWFAQHGYVCLILDTLQLGEIAGLHHGTYREGQWWWNSRGYSPAGVEAWNAVRALDYLATRPEVDTNRFGVTGRSGGGSYSWTLAALDERVKAIAPVAGITDLENQVVDGVVEGHCDCMFFVNTHRWDYPQLAALAAPRALLLVNSDSDTIFPLDGVQRTHRHLKRIYGLHNAAANLGLVIAPGPHKDTQDLQVPVFRWFNRHLKGEEPLIEVAAKRLFTPQQLKVFAELPRDAINTNIQDALVPAAASAHLPSTHEQWARLRDGWLNELKQKCFAGWPSNLAPLQLTKGFAQKSGDLRLEGYDFQSQNNVVLRFYTLRRAADEAPTRLALQVAGSNEARGPDKRTDDDSEALALLGVPDGSKLGAAVLPAKTVRVLFLPRGLGRDAWSGDARKQTQLRRRFMLLGQTLDGMRVWDIRRAIQALRTVPEFRGLALDVEAESTMAVNLLFASLFETGLHQLDLRDLPRSFRQGPDYLNVMKVLDIPQAAALAADNCPLRLHLRDAHGWEYPSAVAQTLHWPPDQFAITPQPIAGGE